MHISAPMWALITHHDSRCSVSCPIFKPQGRRKGEKLAMVEAQPWCVGESSNLNFLSRDPPLSLFDSCQRNIVPEFARLGNPLRNDTACEVLLKVPGAFIEYITTTSSIVRCSVAFANCWPLVLSATDVPSRQGLWGGSYATRTRSHHT
jgi:hypothetical protein